LDSNFKTNGQQVKHRSILHIDRLNLTFKHTVSSPFRNVKNPDALIESQKFGDIELRLDNSCGAAAYYHTFSVYYQGHKVGKLHTASKFNKTDIEFDYEKYVHYCNQNDWWFVIYKALLKELKFEFNNINYIEICLDSTYNLPDAFGFMHANSVNNKYKFNSYFKPFRNTKIDVLDNGCGFRSTGQKNYFHIYNKTLHCEDFIKDFFRLNGFTNESIYRLEIRLDWNYIKSIINRKKVLITPEILLDKGMLAKIFELSVKNKLTFYDLRGKVYDHNRNSKYEKVTLMDDLNLDTSELLQFESPRYHQHYRNENTDEDILRKTYYLFLETGNEKYYRNIQHSAEAAGISDATVLSLIQKFNLRYRGDRQPVLLDRMEFVVKKYSIQKKGNVLHNLMNKIRVNWWQRPHVFSPS